MKISGRREQVDTNQGSGSCGLQGSGKKEIIREIIPMKSGIRELIHEHFRDQGAGSSR
jgi:hypothetical protein